MTEKNDRRRFSRVDFNVPIALSQGEKRWQAELLDISLKGILLEGQLPADCDSEKALIVSIKLSDQALMTMSVQLAHKGEHHTGLECISIDMDSIAHLRRLIELNLGDSKAAERELAELIIGNVRERSV